MASGLSAERSPDARQRHLVAFEESVTYTIRKAARGLFSTLASGEGLVSDFQGPGKLWIQSRNLKGFAQVIASLMPKSSN